MICTLLFYLICYGPYLGLLFILFVGKYLFLYCFAEGILFWTTCSGFSLAFVAFPYIWDATFSDISKRNSLITQKSVYHKTLCCFLLSVRLEIVNGTLPNWRVQSNIFQILYFLNAILTNAFIPFSTTMAKLGIILQKFCC